MNQEITLRRGGWKYGRWAGPQRQAKNWTEIGASMYVIRMLLFGIWDPPDRLFVEGRFLPKVPQSKKDLEFGRQELEDGCYCGIYEEITKQYAEDCVGKGYYVSSAFVDWKTEKGRFIVNLKKQSTHWDKKSTMETLSSFSACLQKGDHMLSFDWKSGYRHFRLHSRMWDWFIFQYDGRFYRCIALPFGWTRSPYWFCHILSPLTRYMRSALRCRILQWIDDYLIVPGQGETPSTSRDCVAISSILDALFARLGLVRHKEKGVWGRGITRLEHLGVIIDTVTFRYFVTPEKLTALQQMAGKLLRTARKGQRWVKENLVREFTGKAISQLLPIPLARFFTRGLYNDIKKDRTRRGRYPETLVRLSNASLTELRAWQSMLEGDGRLIGGGKPEWNLHTDAADVGFGGTLGRDLAAGADGEVHVQKIWSPLLRLRSITTRELLSVRLALQDELVRSRLSEYHGQLLLHVDNMAVFHIVNNMVSAKSELMDELRALHQVLTEMKITLQAVWIPSAVNKHADRLSRTWNPRDLRATPLLLKSLGESLQLQSVRRYWPLGDAPAARAKVIRAQMEDFWGDGHSRL